LADKKASNVNKGIFDIHVIDVYLHLYDVVQVMLECRVLALQERKKALWEFSPADPKTVLSLLHHSWEKMWKSLFLTEEDMLGHTRPFPEEGTDRGLSEESSRDQV
jgi:hypothetical protein